MSDKTAFDLGRVIWEAQIKHAWHPDSATLRMKSTPWPDHIGQERAASHDLAIAAAKAVLKYQAENETT